MPLLFSVLQLTSDPENYNSHQWMTAPQRAELP